jgi:TRAP transporter 4TM/12TM fusion protein
MREIKGFWKVIATILVGGWSLFLFYTALTLPFHPLIQGGVSLAVALALVFILFPLSKRHSLSTNGTLAEKLIFGTKHAPSILDILFVILSLTPCIYIMVNWDTIANEVGRYETYQLALGAILGLLLLEGTRRSLGYAIPAVVLFFLSYTLLGQHIPGFFGHAGYSLPETLYQLYMMNEGIWGLLTDLTSRIIAIFMIFGPIMFAAGVGKTFMDIAMLTGGRTVGGAGQVAVVSSAFFGMLSGSAVANVATTGAFTIPTMKRLGYKPELAAGIEAAASSGGQIMPPIMGAAAFIIAEFLGISYAKVMVAALIPAFIYFAGIWAGIYVEAKRTGIGKLPPEMIPKFKDVFKLTPMLMIFFPVGLLMYLLFIYLPPQTCAAWAIISVIVLYIFTVKPLSVKGLWDRMKLMIIGIYSGVISSLVWMMVMMSCVQMAVTMISLSGFGVKLTEVIMGMAEISVFFALLGTMVAAMILGMGMTTTAAYVITVSVLGPALIGLGDQILAVHLFVLWFAIKAGLTPPVCVDVFTAIAISGGKWLRAAWYAMTLGIGGYILPFFFVYYSVFLMKGSWFEIAVATSLATLAMFPMQAAIMGYWLKPTTVLERALFITGGICLLIPEIITDIIGLSLVGFGLLSQLYLGHIPLVGVRNVELQNSNSTFTKEQKM